MTGTNEGRGTPDPVASPRGAPFQIVGIGASAGGLEAVTQLLKALPPDTGLGFVLVQHLAASHTSALAEILSHATPMPVLEVQDEPVVRRNHVYVMPPGRSMVISGGVLQLLPRPLGIHRPVDQFFRALAEDRRDQAIGIVLSGTASDGTLGLEAIKAEGGITFAQDVTAQHDGMPHSAIASGSVDFVLAPDQIARELVRIAEHTSMMPGDRTAGSSDGLGVSRVLQLLREAIGVDFTQYRFSTLYRRISRRMLLQRVTGLGEYARFLQQTPDEAGALCQDILIGVTSFFRDPEAFELLKTRVFPALTRDPDAHDPLRVWTLGCSTGQEAYSVAIAYAEYAEEKDIRVPLQVFATDLSGAGIDTARTGIYPRDIAEEMSPDRLRRFFVQLDDGYRISKGIRDACVFSRHNVVSDPPFSHIDLVTCRNLLIYLEPALQQKILPVLHYALNPGGFLWLGASETIGTHPDLFDVCDAGHRLYQRQAGSSAAGLYPLQDVPQARSSVIPPVAQLTDAAADLPREADRIVAAKFAPPGVLVSSDLHILQYRGDTSAFLAPAPGKASLSLLRMVREGLLLGVRDAVMRAGRDGVPVRQEGLRIAFGADLRQATVEVIPIRGNGTKQGGFLILFEEDGVAAPGMEPPREVAPPGVAVTGDSASPELVRVGQELSATREYLQTLIEQHEASSEELQSANEEIQSANEELQSANEELETSKEEIESSNEELVTVNEELNRRNLELNLVNSDLTNLLDSVLMPIVIIGPDFRIRRFTASAGKLLRLAPADIGGPLADISRTFERAPALEPLLREVLETASPQEHEVQDRGGYWYALRLRPYRTLGGRIDGVVVMFVDIDTMKRAHEYTASIVATVREPLVVLDPDLRVRTASAAFYHKFHVAAGETIGRLFFDLGNRQWDVPELRRLLQELLPLHSEVSDFEVERDFEHLGRKIMVVNARRLRQVQGGEPAILLAIEDSTERKQLNEALRASEEGLRFTLESAHLGAWDLDLATETARRSLRHDQAFGYDGPVAEWTFGTFLRHVHPLDRAEVEAGFRQAVAELKDWSFECRVIWPDGSEHWIEVHGCIYRDPDGKPVSMLGIVGDVTARRQADAEALQRVEQLAAADRRKDEFLAMLAHELRNPLAPIRNALQVVKMAGAHEPPVLTAIEMIERQVGLVVRLVDDLLDVSRITRGVIELRREWIDLCALVEQAVETARPFCEQLDQVLVMQRPPGALYMDADPIRLGQVVGNLIHNARKFTGRGGGIGLTLEQEGNEAVIRVQDDGIGLAAEQLPDIFELFMQVDVSLERSGSGLGIGLTLVRQLVEQHGGTVHAESAGVGQGSQFVVRLPMSVPPARPLGAERRLPAGPSRRVLVVDDNQDSADSLSTLLQLAGHTTATAYDGPEAIEAAAAFHPEVILLDIGLPILNGFDVGRRIREEPWGRNIVLIALSGWGQDEARRESRAAGFDAHLVKPVEFDVLLRALAETVRVGALAPPA